MSAHRILQNVSRLSATMGRVSGQRANLLRLNPHKYQPAAFISTSKKNSDTTATVTGDQVASPPKTVEDFANPSKKNYQSYGYDLDDRDWDINIRNNVMFFTITVTFIFGSFLVTYMPPVKLRDWTQREAYIELARREALGLPAVDPELVPIDEFTLPSEEELGDFELII